MAAYIKEAIESLKEAEKKLVGFDYLPNLKKHISGLEKVHKLAVAKWRSKPLHVPVGKADEYLATAAYEIGLRVFEYYDFNPFTPSEALRFAWKLAKEQTTPKKQKDFRMKSSNWHLKLYNEGFLERFPLSQGYKYKFKKDGIEKLKEIVENLNQ